MGNPFCLLIHSPWLLVLSLSILFMILSVFNLYLWKNIHFSWNNYIIFLLIYLLFIKSEILLFVLFFVFFVFVFSELLLFVSFFWASCHSLSSPTLGSWPGEGFYLPDPCELTFSNTLLLSNAAVSLGGAFVSLEISLQFIILSSLSSFILAVAFISLQIKEFRIMGLSINDSVYSSLFFFSYRITFLPSSSWSFSLLSFL